MSRAREIKAQAKALREQKTALQAKLEGVQGREARAIRLELARIGEDLVDCSRLLRELMPRHKISRGRTWSGLEGWQWDRLQYQTWAELEGAEEAPEGSTEQDKMRLAVRAARSGISPAQEAYLAGTNGGRRQAQVAREAGRNRVPHPPAGTETDCRGCQSSLSAAGPPGGGTSGGGPGGA